jgi:hypothetical protein
VRTRWKGVPTRRAWYTADGDAAERSRWSIACAAGPAEGAAPALAPAAGAAPAAAGASLAGMSRLVSLNVRSSSTPS